MDPTFSRPFDESLTRELPQLQSLRIAPLRQPVSRTLSGPSPLEPNASGVRESNTASKTSSSSANVPATLPTVAEFLNAARTKKNDSFVDSLPSFEPPPKPILPAFVNLRALERSPYSSFDDESVHARKRRRLDVQGDSFGEHLQLPIPQSQKEQRPPPFGPFAILNGLNEPPPNAALLPPIEAGSIPQLLNKPSRRHSHAEPASVKDGQRVERREGKIEEILDSPLDDKDDKASEEDRNRSEPANGKESIEQGGGGYGKGETEADPSMERHESLSPKPRGRSRKNTRKWTEEETAALLQGVIKCGVGNWKAILAQPELKFNKRTASNLKDRFRFCCPWAYRTADPDEVIKQLHEALARARSKCKVKGSEGLTGKDPISHSKPAHSGTEHSLERLIISPNEQSTRVTTQGRADRSNKASPEASHGVIKSKAPAESPVTFEPYVTLKNRRRSRHLFTDAEDEALVKGYAAHGFQWTLIQQDKRLNLGHRKATDLRDRFRNKFPEVYRHGGAVGGKALQAEGNSRLEATEKAQAAKQKKPRLLNRIENTSHSARPLDAALSPLAPPHALLPDASASFQLPDDHSGTSSDTPWEDNTLPPMIWDELP